MKYRSRTTSHGWVVVVTRRTPASVTFRVTEGPGKSRGKLFRLKVQAFRRLYQPTGGSHGPASRP